MAWFIIQCERKTWTKYLVEAEDRDAAMQGGGNWRYLGYVDGDDIDSAIVGGRYETREDALGDAVSYVEG